MGKRKIILALAGAALGVCICSAIYQMDQVKGPAVELADFTDIPYQEGLNRMSEDCVYDLDFDGRTIPSGSTRITLQTGMERSPLLSVAKSVTCGSGWTAWMSKSCMLLFWLTWTRATSAAI